MALTPGDIRRGAVVLVRLPRDKAGPAVVVRSDLLHELAYATVLPITSDVRTGISIRIDIAPHPLNGIRVPSQVMVDWPQTVGLSEMGESIGHLDTLTMQAITRQMAVVLGLAAGSGLDRRQRPIPTPAEVGTPLLRPPRP